MSFKARQKNTHTFNIDYTSDTDHERYQGTFTTKRLSVRDLAALGVRKAQLNGGFYHDADNPGRGVDEQTDEFNSMLAHLELSIVDAPDWWDLDRLNEVGLIGEVYGRVIEFESSFLGRGDKDTSSDGQSGRSSEGNSQASEKGSDDDGNSSEVVDGQVPSALEP